MVLTIGCGVRGIKHFGTCCQLLGNHGHITPAHHWSIFRFCFGCVFLQEPGHTQEHLEVHDLWLVVIKITINMTERCEESNPGVFIRVPVAAWPHWQSEIIRYLSSTLGKPHPFLPSDSVKGPSCYLMSRPPDINKRQAELMYFPSGRIHGSGGDVSLRVEMRRNVRVSNKKLSIRAQSTCAGNA